MKIQNQKAGETTVMHSRKKEGKAKSKPEETPPKPEEVLPPSDTNGKSSEPAQASSDNGAQETQNGNELKEIVVSENESSASEIIDIVEIQELPVPSDSEQKSPEEIVKPPQEEKSSEHEVVQVESVVESTTPESDVKPEEKPVERTEESVKPEDDPSFINYDASIMLKDVQIKLNDCLKDNSKLMDVTDPNASATETFKDLSFGRTLRNISGRASLGRARYERHRQLTLNDSLFVNTSFTQGDGTTSFADSPRRNGTPLKRKLTSETDEPVKKPKQEETSIFNTSIEYIKNLRRPVQVSTPKPKGCELNLDEKPNEDFKVEVEAEPKKWCVVM
uniref:Uncharacterized protein n=1 Tax=Bracon brevicornis TaxID=1563983 RepID=A0A6V7J8X0_9HYME